MALLAALVLAVNPHPLHAQAEVGTDHGHLGFLCEAPNSDEIPSNGAHDPQGLHGDCLHHFDPLVRAPIEHPDGLGALTEARPHVDPARQPVLTSDPPPPRNPS